jgi:hypothetical protein
MTKVFLFVTLEAKKHASNEERGEREKFVFRKVPSWRCVKNEKKINLKIYFLPLRFTYGNSSLQTSHKTKPKSHHVNEVINI